MKLPAALVVLFAISGCAAPVSSPMERHARMAKAGDLVARECAGVAGGYTDMKAIREDSAKNAMIARELGATPAVMAKAAKDVQSNYATAYFVVGEYDACSQLMAALSEAQVKYR